MKISQIGEFALIEIIKKNTKRLSDTLVGIGDDAAVLKYPLAFSKAKYQLITTDTLIENVHFKTKGLSYFKLGLKSLAVNISDIAAMGGVPRHALVTIGVPKNFKVVWIRQLYRGIRQLARHYRIDIIGGDTVLSPKGLIVSITLLGEVEPGNVVLRSTAKPGDLLCVTGKFGGPAAQRYAGRESLKVRLSEARQITKNKLATAMIDSSDGLVRSVLEICRSSKVGARIIESQVPIAKGATLDNALYGGEEYELVFTLNKHQVKKLSIIGGQVTIVGEIVDRLGGVKTVNSYGKIKPLKSGGFEHFRQ